MVDVALQTAGLPGASQPLYFSWRVPERKRMGRLDVPSGSAGESGFHRYSAVCFPSSSCHCLFDSDHPVSSPGKTLLHIQRAATIRLQ